MIRRFTAREAAVQTALWAGFGLFSLACFYPLYYILMYSLSDSKEAMLRLPLLWPSGFTLANYARVFALPNIGNAFFISLARTGVGTAAGTFMTAMFAFCVSHPQLPAKRFFYRATVATMYLNAGLIPWYITMVALGLKDNFLLYILPPMVGAYNMILVKTFIEQIPAAMRESAEIDGANPMQVFVRIMLPLCLPVLASIIVFTAVFHWNAWTDNFYLVKNANLQTMQMTLLSYLKEAENIAKQMEKSEGPLGQMTIARTLTPTSIRMTLTIVATLPILLVYPFMQRYFISGIMIGAVKG